MKYFIGIDPSINSTGICIQKYDEDNNKINENFLIITGNCKLTKREQIAQDSIYEFEYIFYDKEDLKQYKEDNHLHEYYKSYNMIKLSQTIKNTINEFTKETPKHLYIVIEGISYGSSNRTKSIYDLAGINYLIRENFINKENITFTIATPSEIKKFATGNGNCNKDVMSGIFISINDKYSIVPKVDDICDAWFMSNYAKLLYEKNIEE